MYILHYISAIFFTTPIFSSPLAFLYTTIYQGMNTDTVSSREGRYNAVFHLVTAAEGAEKYYSLGKFRHSLPLFLPPLLPPSYSPLPLFLTLLSTCRSSFLSVILPLAFPPFLTHPPSYLPSSPLFPFLSCLLSLLI